MGHLNCFTSEILSLCLNFVFVSRVIALDEKSSRWTADFAIVFVEKTNFLLKKTIETGAKPASAATQTQSSSSMTVSNFSSVLFWWFNDLALKSIRYKQLSAENTYI